MLWCQPCCPAGLEAPVLLGKHLSWISNLHQLRRAAGRWAVGVLLYEMLAGYPPWQDGNTYAVYRAVMRCQLAFPHHFDPDAQVALAPSTLFPVKPVP